MMFQKIKSKLNKELESDFSKAMEKPASYLTPNELNKIKEGKKTLADYEAKIHAKVTKEYYKEDFDKLAAAEAETREINKISISFDWFKSKAWGSNPKAKVQVDYKNGTTDFYYSSKIGGCGYDRESTATAEALNQCPAIMKELYKIKEERLEKDIKENICYGVSNGTVPDFSGGVGFDFHRVALEILGYSFSHSVSRKNLDIYQFVKIEE